MGERRNANALEEGSSTLSNPPWHWSWHKNRGLWLQKCLLDEETSVILRQRNLSASTSSHLRLQHSQQIWDLRFLLKTVVVIAFNSLHFKKQIHIIPLLQLKINFHFDYEVQCFLSLHQRDHSLFLITKFKDDRRCSTFGNKNDFYSLKNQANVFFFTLPVLFFSENVKYICCLNIWSCHLFTSHNVADSRDWKWNTSVAFYDDY